MNQINVQPGQKAFEFTEQEYVITKATGPFPDVAEVRITNNVKKITIDNQQQPIFPNVKKLIIEKSHMVFYDWKKLFTTIDTVSLQFIESVQIDNLKNLGGYIANFEITEQNPHYMAIDGILYAKDGTSLLLCPRLKRGDVLIPEGVQIIEKDAFRNCSVTSVILPKSLQKIRPYAFCHCYNLSQVDFCDGIETIENLAFHGCRKLHMVTLPSSIQHLGSYCFSKVQNIYIQFDRLPDGIVDSISAPWSKDFVTITNNSQTIIIPKDFTWSSIRNLDNIMQNPPIDRKALDTMFLYAYTEESKIKTAFAIYQRFQSTEAAQHLKKHSSEALNLFVKEHQDKQIIDFIQLGLASLNDLKSLLSDEYIQNNTIIKAYILQTINLYTGHTNDTFKL